MTVVGWTPMFAPFALLRYVPGVSPIGKRVYNRVASSRPRDAACTDEVCGIHPPAPAAGRPQRRPQTRTGRPAR